MADDPKPSPWRSDAKPGENMIDPDYKAKLKAWQERQKAAEPPKAEALRKLMPKKKATPTPTPRGDY